MNRKARKKACIMFEAAIRYVADECGIEIGVRNEETLAKTILDETEVMLGDFIKMLEVEENNN